jgi:hypothetical protein
MDPALDPGLDTKLVKLCNSNTNGAAFLDQNTSFVVDIMNFTSRFFLREV